MVEYLDQEDYLSNILDNLNELTFSYKFTDLFEEIVGMDQLTFTDQWNSNIKATDSSKTKLIVFLAFSRYVRLMPLFNVFNKEKCSAHTCWSRPTTLRIPTTLKRSVIREEFDHRDQTSKTCNQLIAR